MTLKDSPVSACNLSWETDILPVLNGGKSTCDADPHPIDGCITALNVNNGDDVFDKNEQFTYKCADTRENKSTYINTVKVTADPV